MAHFRPQRQGAVPWERQIGLLPRVEVEVRVIDAVAKTTSAFSQNKCNG